MASEEDEELWTPDLETDEEKDQFIRGVMMAQVWAKVVKEPPEEIAALHKEDDEIAEEWRKLTDGEPNNFERMVADYYGVPYRFTSDDKIRLQHPYARRYEKAWVELGVEPSIREKIANAVFLGVLSRGGDGGEENE